VSSQASGGDGSDGRRGGKRALVLLALVVVVVGGTMWPSLARADKVDDLMLQLRSDPDYKVRLSAVLSLGKLGDRRAIAALIDGLADPDKSVRLVAAGALGKLVDATVPGDERARVANALSTVARSDAEQSVRSQAQRSFDALHSLPSPGGHGVYVEIGGMADKTLRGAAVIPVMRQTVLVTLQKQAPTYLLHAAGGRPAVEADWKRPGTTAFFVDASLTRLDATGGHVACAVSMIIATYPQKSMFGFLNGSAEVDVGSGSGQAVVSAQGDCVSAVMDDLVSSKIVPTIQARVP
jgi:HEAT repeats